LRLRGAARAGSVRSGYGTAMWIWSNRSWVRASPCPNAFTTAQAPRSPPRSTFRNAPARRRWS